MNNNSGKGLGRMKKITFIGDIMCEEPLLKASRKGKCYDFSNVFEGCKEFFSQSDFVVGNLETVFAGKEAGYTKEMFSFNTPDAFAEAIREAGINLVTTATNHALDRDIKGLTRTLDILDQVGIEHIGAYRIENERNDIYTKEFGNLKIAFLNYTYGTNTYESPYYIDESEYYRLNLLMPQKHIKVIRPKGVRAKFSVAIKQIIPERYLIHVRKILGKSYTNNYTDVLNEKEIDESYLERLRSDIQKAKGLAEIVIVCLHIGGQFNSNPGTLVQYFIKLIQEAGADYIINTHAHVVQRMKQFENSFVAYCLGNFSISPSSAYISHKLKPEYSIALHLYVDDSRVVKKTFSILKIIENKYHKITVKPVDEIVDKLSKKEKDILEKDVAFIYERFTGNLIKEIALKREFLV